MNVVNRVVLKEEVGEFSFNFVCAPNSPLPETRHALVQMLAYVDQRIEEVKAQQEAEAPKVEVVEPEVEVLEV